MYRIIYYFITIITKLHAKLLSINDNHGLNLTDKQLHFLVIGIFGFGMMFLIQPVFKWLSKHYGMLFISFIYVFSAVIVISFAIEIGQAYSGSGEMDFVDIAYGILGFFTFFFIYMIIYLIWNHLHQKKSS